MPITTLRICNEGYPSIVVLITFPEDEARRKYHHWRSVNNMLNKKYRRQPTENKYKLSNRVEYFHIFFGQSNGQTISFNVQSKTQTSTILANTSVYTILLKGLHVHMSWASPVNHGLTCKWRDLTSYIVFICFWDKWSETSRALVHILQNLYFTTKTKSTDFSLFYSIKLPLFCV